MREVLTLPTELATTAVGYFRPHIATSLLGKSAVGQSSVCADGEIHGHIRRCRAHGEHCHLQDIPYLDRSRYVGVIIRRSRLRADTQPAPGALTWRAAGRAPGHGDLGAVPDLGTRSRACCRSRSATASGLFGQPGAVPVGLEAVSVTLEGQVTNLDFRVLT
jgi:hypothetical protein